MPVFVEESCLVAAGVLQELAAANGTLHAELAGADVDDRVL